MFDSWRPKVKVSQEEESHVILGGVTGSLELYVWKIVFALPRLLPGVHLVLVSQTQGIASAGFSIYLLATVFGRNLVQMVRAKIGKYLF